MYEVGACREVDVSILDMSLYKYSSLRQLIQCTCIGIVGEVGLSKALAEFGRELRTCVTHARILRRALYKAVFAYIFAAAVCSTNDGNSSCELTCVQVAHLIVHVAQMHHLQAIPETPEPPSVRVTTCGQQATTQLSQINKRESHKGAWEHL